MLFSFALIFLVGMLLGKMFETIKLPKLLGMLLSGILLGPHFFNLISSSILEISTELRQIALIIILARAGLNLDIKDMKKVGRPALLMCFLPACFEIFGMLVLAPKILKISVLESAIMGCVVAAVSPAVIVPRMLDLMKNGYGTNKNIPQIIMTGASVDDVFVIVLFTVFVGIAKNGNFTPTHFLIIPTSIIFGLIAGILLGRFLSFVFSKSNIQNTIKIIIILSVSFVLVTIEKIPFNSIGFSGLLAVMALGASIKQKNQKLSIQLSEALSKLWIGAEIVLFTLVGASVNIDYALKAKGSTVLLIFGALIFRFFGVFVSLIKTNLNIKEKVFIMLAYMPKATVQAAIGGLPLAMGLACGDIVLTVAVISIIITAPIGATLIDATYKKLLSKKDENINLNG